MSGNPEHRDDDAAGGLAARLAALERRVHRMRGAVVLLSIGLLIAVAWIVAPRPELEAQRFMLRDSTGAWRGALMMNAENEPVVRLNDRLGHARIYGRVGADGRSHFRLADSTSTSRIVLEVLAGGASRITMTDSVGHTVMTANVSRDGRGTVARRDTAAARR